MRRYLSVFLLILLAFGACSRNKPNLSTEERLALADEYYANGKYSKAATIYDEPERIAHVIPEPHTRLSDWQIATMP